MWGWEAWRRTNGCQSELLSLSRVSALNNLSSTLVKLGSVFVCLVLHARILSNVSAQALLSALLSALALSQPGGRSWLTMTYGKCISTSPYSPLPPLPPTGLAYLIFPLTRLKDNMFGCAFDDQLWTMDWQKQNTCSLWPTPTKISSGFTPRRINDGCDHCSIALKSN